MDGQRHRVQRKSLPHNSLAVKRDAQVANHRIWLEGSAPAAAAIASSVLLCERNCRCCVFKSRDVTCFASSPPGTPHTRYKWQHIFSTYSTTTFSTTAQTTNHPHLNDKPVIISFRPPSNNAPSRGGEAGALCITGATRDCPGCCPATAPPTAPPVGCGVRPGSSAGGDQCCGPCPPGTRGAAGVPTSNLAPACPRAA